MKNEKVYVPSTFGRTVTFQDGGEIYNLDFINKDELISFINENADAKGAFRIQVQKQKNDPTKLSVTLNTYVPKQKADNDDGDSLPF